MSRIRLFPGSHSGYASAVSGISPMFKTIEKCSILWVKFRAGVRGRIPATGQRWHGYGYNLNELLDLIDIYMLPIQKKYAWGIIYQTILREYTALTFIM
jgi:hypothetical protein